MTKEAWEAARRHGRPAAPDVEYPVLAFDGRSMTREHQPELYTGRIGGYGANWIRDHLIELSKCAKAARSPSFAH